MNKCAICEDQLEPSFQDSKYQPYEGGEIRFIFNFGSTKFDKCIGSTVYRGVICDHCASKFVNRMDETLEE